MNTDNTITSRGDDVVFENRNKDYGAYSIRHSYLPNLSKGSGGGILFFGLVIAAVQLVMMLNPNIAKLVAPTVPPIGLKPVPDIIRDVQPPKQIQPPPRANTELPPRVVLTPVEELPTVQPAA